MASLSFEAFASRLSSSDYTSQLDETYRPHKQVNAYQSLTKSNQPMLDKRSLAECFPGTLRKSTVLGPLHAIAHLDQ